MPFRQEKARLPWGTGPDLGTPEDPLSRSHFLNTRLEDVFLEILVLQNVLQLFLDKGQIHLDALQPLLR